jgi:hypothetical protein
VFFDEFGQVFEIQHARGVWMARARWEVYFDG